MATLRELSHFDLSEYITTRRFGPVIETGNFRESPGHYLEVIAGMHNPWVNFYHFDTWVSQSETKPESMSERMPVGEVMGYITEKYDAIRRSRDGLAAEVKPFADAKFQTELREKNGEKRLVLDEQTDHYHFRITISEQPKPLDIGQQLCRAIGAYTFRILPMPRQP